MAGKTTFIKSAGGWAFRIEGHEFVAWRNEAGFAGRDWELWPVNNGTDAWGVTTTFPHIDMVASRGECVTEAERMVKRSNESAAIRKAHGLA